METVLNVDKLNCKNKNFELNNISFKILPGKVYCLFGKNGSGKSTIIRNVIYLNNIKKQNFIKYNSKESDISYASNEIPFPETYNSLDINLICKNIFMSWDSSNFLDMINILNLPTNRPLKEMSTGMQAKLNILIALNRNSRLMILDESMNGIDSLTKILIKKKIKEYLEINKENSVLFVSHVFSDINDFADKLLILKNGKIYETEGKLSEKNLERLL